MTKGKAEPGDQGELVKLAIRLCREAHPQIDPDTRVFQGEPMMLGTPRGIVRYPGLSSHPLWTFYTAMARFIIDELRA